MHQGAWLHRRAPYRFFRTVEKPQSEIRRRHGDLCPRLADKLRPVHLAPPDVLPTGDHPRRPDQRHIRPGLIHPEHPPVVSRRLFQQHSPNHPVPPGRAPRKGPPAPKPAHGRRSRYHQSNTPDTPAHRGAEQTTYTESTGPASLPTCAYQRPINFQYANPTVPQIARFATPTIAPTRHQSFIAT